MKNWTERRRMEELLEKVRELSEYYKAEVNCLKAELAALKDSMSEFICDANEHISLQVQEIEALRQIEPFTIQVEIPKTTDGGFCSDRCLLKSLLGCKKELSVSGCVTEYTDRYRYTYKPGPLCPRHYKPSIETDQVC